MIGYKGIELRNGILRAKYTIDAGDIFEIGVPKQVVEINDGMAFYETGYSFCGAMEHVLQWENYLDLSALPGAVHVKLFRVEAPDAWVVGGSSHFKTKQITVIEEVSREEIVKYYIDNPDKLPVDSKEMFEKYCTGNWEPYRRVLDHSEIEKMIVSNCMRRNQESVCL